MLTTANTPCPHKPTAGRTGESYAFPEPQSIQIGPLCIIDNMKKLILLITLVFHFGLTHAQSEYVHIDSVLSGINLKGEFNGISPYGNKDSVQVTKACSFANMTSKVATDLKTELYIAPISKQYMAASLLLCTRMEAFNSVNPLRIHCISSHSAIQCMTSL